MNKKAEPIVTLGMTKRMMEEVSLRKASNDLEKIPGNLASKLKDEHFAKQYADYELPMHERFHYHVAMEDREFDRQTGRRTSVATVQKFDESAWKTFKESDIFKAKTSELVHNPALEDAGAPLVTLKYTLTDDEIEIARLQAEKVKKEKAAAAASTPLTLNQVNALEDVKEAKEYLKSIGGKPGKDMTLDKAKAAIIEVGKLA